MPIFEVRERKKDYLDLLLLADEQESMIDRYLDKGTMYGLEEGGVVRGVCVVTDEGCGVLELKNLAVRPEDQRRGYGARLVAFLARRYRGEYRRMQVGTGESPLTIPFYERCGFVPSHRVKNFFPEHYDHPIFECGRQLIDMVYLTMPLDGRGSAAGD
ncbi:MAG TPA: GNAT family N-acetyltransferase [Candidatus Galloscillospira excrementavium]|nr:GNAT family N-acetyltransferase [Candidatus Galloscillospira excrementavium]